MTTRWACITWLTRHFPHFHLHSEDKSMLCRFHSPVNLCDPTWVKSRPKKKKKKFRVPRPHEFPLRCKQQAQQTRTSSAKSQIAQTRKSFSLVREEKKFLLCLALFTHTHLHSFPSHEPAAAISMYPWGLKLETFNVGFQTNLNEENRGCGKVFRSSGSLTLQWWGCFCVSAPARAPCSRRNSGACQSTDEDRSTTLHTDTGNLQQTHTMQSKNCGTCGSTQLTPSMPQLLKFLGWKAHSYMPPNSVFWWSYNNSIFNTVLFNSNPLTCSCEGQEGPIFFLTWPFYWLFSEWQHSNERVNECHCTASPLPSTQVGPLGEHTHTVLQ